MGFLKHLFKPIGSIEKGIKHVFDGVVTHPLNNITSGIGKGFAGVGKGVSALGSGVGSGVSSLGSGVGKGVSSLGSGLGGLIDSPILLIGGAVVVLFLIAK